MLLTTYVVRVAIASVLLFGGILWLARTTSIEELMLNAVALNSILDVDEFLFAGMAPIKIQHAIQNVTPIRIRYSRFRSQLESLVHFSALLTLILLSYFLLLVPLSDAMLAVKSELCGGIQRFVVSYNAATQMTIGLATTNFDDVQNLSYSQTVILAHRDSVPGIASELIGFAANHDSFQSEVSRTMEEEATRYPTCIETEVLKEGSPYYTDPTLQSLAALLINSAAGALGRAGARSCQELQDKCDDPDARLLRMVCGETCGCIDPFSSPWYKVPAQGCAAACLELGRAQLQNHSCQDMPVDDTWRAFWAQYGNVLSHYFGQPVETTQAFALVNQTLPVLAMGGCPVLVQFPVDHISTTVWCEGTSDLVRFFRLLDTDGDGDVREQDFTEGVLHLRGPARTIDVACEAEDNRRMKAKLGQMEAQDRQTASVLRSLALQLTHIGQSIEDLRSEGWSKPPEGRDTQESSQGDAELEQPAGKPHASGPEAATSERACDEPCTIARETEKEPTSPGLRPTVPQPPQSPSLRLLASPASPIGAPVFLLDATADTLQAASNRVQQQIEKERIMKWDFDLHYDVDPRMASGSPCSETRGTVTVDFSSRAFPRS
eukprot:s624_g8.t1